MIILTAGHTGANSGAQCAETHFDEGAENIWLRNRIAEILTNKYNLIVLIDNDHASLQLLTKELSRDTACCVRSPQRSKNNPTSVEIQRALLTKSNSESLNPNGEKSFQSVLSVGEKNNSEGVKFVDRRPLNRRSLSLWRKNVDDFIIDIHFNAHTNPQARGAEAIVSDDATELELRMASRLAHATADSLEIPLRGIKSESETPHRRLAMLHLTPQSIILEVCFCTSPEDVEQYRRHRRKIASTIARTIAELIE